jgi:excisionase family DNA binding protein
MTSQYSDGSRVPERTRLEDADNVSSLGLMTPGEVAAILHVDANTVARWSNDGKLRAVRTPGGHRRYYAVEVLEIARNGVH